jgi:GNAT superfamily N-acetyltransferase
MIEAKEIHIVEYEEKYSADFKSLNEEWISTYFKIEDADRKVLDNPKSYILDNGGKIFVALYNNEAVGVCAMIKMDDPDYDYELAKMAVSPLAQGNRIGWLLAQTVIKAAKELGSKKLYLESNTALKPAINLYQKLGFKQIMGRSTPYSRCNIQMELTIL